MNSEPARVCTFPFVLAVRASFRPVTWPVPLRENFHRHHVEQEPRPVGLGQFLLEIVRGHLRLAAAINDDRVARAQAPGLRDGVNGGVAAPDDRDAVAHRHLVQRARVNLFDELERLDHFRQILARDVQPRAFAQPQPEENGVEFLLSLLDRQSLPTSTPQRNSTPRP